MSNFLGKDSFVQRMVLEERLWDEMGDEIGYFDDVMVYFSEDDGTILQVFAKGASDDAEPLKEFWVELSVTEKLERG